MLIRANVVNSAAKSIHARVFMYLAPFLAVRRVTTYRVVIGGK